MNEQIKLEGFFPCKPFQPSVMLAGKAGTYPSREWEALDLACKYYTWLKRPAKDKHSSLFEPFVSYKEKSFSNMALDLSGWNVYIMDTQLSIETNVYIFDSKGLFYKYFHRKY